VTRSFLMALDAGGGGGHCLLVETGSGTFTRAFRAWTHSAAPGTGGLGADLDLEMIWTRLAEAAREALQVAGAAAAEIAGIAATSMRHTTVVLDGTGVPVFATPNRDSRAVTDAFQLASEQGDTFYARTGHWPSPLSTAPRLRWLATFDPETWKRAATVMTLSDWVTYRLCGEIATDPSQAGETLLLDVARRDWAWDLIERLQIPRQLFPTLRQPGTRLGGLTAAAAKALGLRAGIPVAAGGGDTQCGLLGAGAVATGQVAVIAGTTMPVQLVLDRACIDAQQRLWTGCHVVPGLWVLESNAGAIGEALDWFARLLHPDAIHPAARFLAEAGSSEAGAAGMLSTIGGDVMNARELKLPTGSLTLSHLTTAHDPQRRRHLERAVVEGMAYTLRANLDQLREVAGVEISALNLAGGMSRSEVFAQVVADVVNLPVTVGATREATALGAAICAGVGAGVFSDLASGARALGRQARTLPPDAPRAQTYHELYDGWQRLRAAHASVEAVAAQIMLPSVLRDMSRAAVTGHAAVRPRILVTADMDDAALAALRALGDVEYASFRQVMRLLTGPPLVDALQKVQVFITEIDIVDADALRQLPDLRVVAACRGDAVNVDRAACSAFGVPVLYAPGRNADAVADLTVAFLLMLARKLPQATAFLHEPGAEPGDMARMGLAFTTLQGRELWQKTVGLVGLGAVGRGVAKRLAAFGARVLVYDPYVRPEQVIMADAEPVGLDELLRRSDFVSLHAPVTDETRGLIGAAALAQMKVGACLVNTARAALVDEEALAAALRSGQLAGAALDVFSVEPPGPDHPLLLLDNVIGTPHVGGNTTDVGAHQGRIVAEDLRRLLSGERPQHVLNPDVLGSFDWSKPRPAPTAEALAALAGRPAPAVSDLQRDRTARTGQRPVLSHVEGPVPPVETHTPPSREGGTGVPPVVAAPVAVPAEIQDRMQRILRGFIAGMKQDAALRAFAAGKHVSLHFTLTDLALSFYFRLSEGTVSGDLGGLDGADVKLRMRADILDGMFTGRVNAMQAATSGRLSFSGDTVKAMTLQQVQSDLSRLYKAAREAVGDPGDLASIPEPGKAAAAAPSVQPVGPGDVRDELVEIVNELYAAQLITATGGNVSVRIPGTNEIWITPSQFFKGHLTPQMLVRLDLDGNCLDEGALSPSSERLMHCAIYRARSDAQAVVHAHAPHATILANSGLPFLPVSTEAAFFGDIPRVPFIMPGTQDLADAVATAAEHSWAVLMQNHGLIVGGRSLRRAADMVEIIDRSAEVILGCYSVGKPPSMLPKDVVEMLQKMGDLLA
jgi:sugar (pentulose or hexulose) kinase/phosphoglycerate dehydrogenase-like enzyme/ribulose-5-phosphate 4-epimerase/fuculose-1-phosphate aldolase/putative sterol carrier protein